MKKPSIKQLKKETWQAIAKYVRQVELFCASCGIVCSYEESDCGHFKPNSERNMNLGGNALWFDLRNLHKQCRKCNRFASGNLSGYSIYLEKKYGYGILQEIHKLYNTYKLWTVEELKELKDLYTQKLDELKYQDKGYL